MGVLSRLFGRQKEREHQPSGEPQAECPHVVLIPHWDGVDDIGKLDRVTWYGCEACSARFSREEGERIETEALRGLAEQEIEARTH